MLWAEVSRRNNRLHQLGLVDWNYVPESNPVACFVRRDIHESAILTARSIGIVLIPAVRRIDDHVSVRAG